MESDIAVSDAIFWSPHGPPSHPKKTPPIDFEPIRIKHPAYDENCNTLLKFQPVDHGGAHYNTVHAACACLLDSEWNRYLSEDRAGEVRINQSPESILQRKIYYLHVSHSRMTDPQYPVVPSFEHWQFPPKIPSNWQDILYFKQESRPDNDQACRLTQRDYSVEDAHLVPAAERDWFYRNSMQDYVSSTGVDKMKDQVNTVRFKSDVHSVFDAKRFAIVPVQQRLVAYCFGEIPGSQIEREFHGVELHRLRLLEHSPKFLLARFAYTVFEHFRDFLDASVSRKLLLRRGHEWVTEDCDSERCRHLAMMTARQGKSRSASPKKRPRAQDAEELEDTYTDWDDADEQRGRKRRRSASSSPVSLSFGSSGTSDDDPIFTPNSDWLSMQTRKALTMTPKQVLIDR